MTALAWALEWGPYEAVLWDGADAKALPEPLMRRPALPDWCRPYWEAFWEAAHGRALVLGYGAAAYMPLPLTELRAALPPAVDRDPDERRLWLKILQAMDAAFVAHVNRRGQSGG